MQIRILGAHQGESRDIRFMSILIDDCLAIDAGGLTAALSLEEQHAIDAVLITHQHFDHIKDLPMLAHNLWETKNINIYCTYNTRLMLERHIFNDEIWPSMVRDTPDDYRVIFHAVEPGLKFDLLGYSILPVSMVHTVPTVGYMVEREGKSMFYTADTRSSGDPEWIFIRPDLLIIETTMSNRYDSAARRFKHMTPMALGEELRTFHARQGYYPRTICVHINPRHEQQVREELAELSRELQVEITPAYEGMTLEI